MRGAEEANRERVLAGLRARIAAEGGPSPYAVHQRARKAAETLRPKNDRDADLIAKAATLASTHFSEDWLEDALEAVRQIRPRNRLAYFHRCLAEAATAAGEDFNRLLATCQVPPLTDPAEVR